jgi:hypothetical protein
MSGQSVLTPEPGQLRFLERISLGDTVYEACQYCDVDRMVAEQWLEDKTFQRRYKLAQEDAADLLEKEARRRAVDGVEKGVYFKGEKCDTEVQYSDSLMMFLLKGRRRDVFGDKVDVNADIRHTSIIAVLKALPMIRPAILAEAANDRKDEGRVVQGEVGEGQEPRRALPDPHGSAEASAAG